MVTFQQTRERRGNTTYNPYDAQEDTLYNYQPQEEVEEVQTYTTEIPDTTFDDVTETPDYTGETEYKTDELTGEENEYTIVKTFMPNVEREFVQQVPVEIQRKTVTRTKVKLNTRGKIFACMYSLVATLLIAFSIYNAVALANVNKSISYKEQQYTKLNSEVNSLNVEYTNLNNYGQNGTNIPDGYQSVNSNNTVKLTIDQRPEFIEVSADGNWFNTICEFLSNLF